MQEANSAEFVVTIVACGPILDGLVYAVTVSQPVQSWTVVRSHDDFLSVSKSLSQILVGLPSCPSLSQDVLNFQKTSNLEAVVAARNDIQQWLSSILMYPGARDSPAIRNFLTAGANTIAPQFEQVIWTQFNVVLPPPPATISRISTEKISEFGIKNTVSSVNVDDMEMDDMFLADDDGTLTATQHEDTHDNEIPSASERYKPTDEAVTDADELDIMQFAGEVEMVDDIGSLAQSLGASHLGRSLHLQAEMKHKIKVQQDISKLAGLTAGCSQEFSAVDVVSGGLDSAMKHAAFHGDQFKSRPTSVPRLDSFKMIKVIGKGSFGTSYQYIVFNQPILHVQLTFIFVQVRYF
jgi:hypothetical protein